MDIDYAILVAGINRRLHSVKRNRKRHPSGVLFFILCLIESYLRGLGRLKPDDSGRRLIPEWSRFIGMWFDSTDLRIKKSTLVDFLI